MTNVGILHLLLIFVVALSGLKRLHGVSADYAPEKMDLDNEARLEMNLEPRSSIPHPKNSVPVTPAATLYEPPSEDGSGIEGSNNHEEEKKKDSNNEEIKQTTSTNNTAAPENTPAITSPFTNAPNASSSNVNSTYFPFQPDNQNTSSTEVSPPESVQNPADDLKTSNENEKAKQQANVSNLTTNTEETVSVESISFGTPSKPLTPIKSEQEVEDKADDTKTAKHHKNKPTAAAFNRPATTPTPITTAAKHQDKNKDNKSKMEDNNESDLDLESGSGTDDQDKPEGPNYTPPAQQGKQSASTNVSRDSDNDDNSDSNNDSSHDSKNVASFDSNNDSSHDSDNDSNHDSNNDASHDSNNDASHHSNDNDSHDSDNDSSRDSNNDASHDSNNDDSRVNDANDSNDDDDYDEADDDLEDDSGSGHDENEPFLHDNHTLTSTRGSLKVEAKKRPIVEESTVADKDTEKAVEDAIDRETDYEDNDTEEDKNNIEDERKENQVDKPKPTQLSQKFEKEDGNLNETGTNKSTETKPKADITLSKTHLSKKEHNKVKGVKKTSTEKDSKKVKHVKPEKKEKNGAEQHRIFNQPQPKAYKPLFKYIKKANLHLKTPKAKKTPEPTCNSEDIKTGFSLKGGTRAGHVDDLGESAGIRECIKRCCRKDVCDVALLLDGRCFGVSCFTKDLCQPVPIPHPHYVASQIAFLKQAQRRTEVGRLRPELDCKYGELTIRNKHRWTGELCGGVLACKNGIIHLEKCPGIPPKPKNCANPKLYIKQRPGRCCIKKWLCKDKSCMYGVRKIPHGVSLSDPLCTGIISCYNGHLKTTQCPGIPTKPENCANPRLKITSIPGKCCRRKWVCQDKGCTYNKLKVDHGERLTDASCAVVMECNNGFLNFKQCPSTPAIPHGCINPKLKVKRVLGECCHMKWACAPEI